METKILYNHFIQLGIQDILPKIQHYVDEYNNKFRNLQQLVINLNDIFSTKLSPYHYPGTNNIIQINYFRNFLKHNNKYKEAVYRMIYFGGYSYETKLRNKYLKFMNPQLSTNEIEDKIQTLWNHNFNCAKQSSIIHSKKRTFWMNRLKTNTVIREYFLSL